MWLEKNSRDGDQAAVFLNTPQAGRSDGARLRVVRSALASLGVCAAIIAAGCDDLSALSRGFAGSSVDLAVSCDGGLSACGGSCVDIMTDGNHCGGCGTACVANHTVTNLCVAGHCNATCASGFTDCDANPANGCEANLDSDPRNCGQCNNPCATGLACTGQHCVVVPLVDTFRNLAGLSVDAGGLCVGEAGFTPDPGALFCMDAGGGNRRKLLSGAMTQYDPYFFRQSNLYGSYFVSGNNSSNHFKIDRGGAGQPIVTGAPAYAYMTLGTTGIAMADKDNLYLYDFNLGAPLWTTAHLGRTVLLGSDGRGIIYWIDGSGIHRLDENTKSASLLVAQLPAPVVFSAWEIAVASDALYWVTFGNPDVIWRYDFNAATAAPVYNSSSHVAGVVTDGTDLYFLEGWGSSDPDTLRRLHGRVATTVLDSIYQGKSLRFYADYLYWVAFDAPISMAKTRNSAIYRLHK